MTSELRELVWLPRRDSPSTSVTSRPLRARALAKASPITPPPTTTASSSSVTPLWKHSRDAHLVQRLAVEVIGRQVGGVAVVDAAEHTAEGGPDPERGGVVIGDEIAPGDGHGEQV